MTIAPRNLVLRTFCMSALLFVFSVFAVGQTVVTVSPMTNSVRPGETHTLDIVVENVTNLCGIHMVLTFNNAIIRATTIGRGSFLGDSVFFAEYPPPGPAVATMVVDQAALGTAGVTGSGVLFSLTYVAVGAGTSAITVSSILLRDPFNHSIPVSALQGSVTVEDPLASVSVSLIQAWNMISLPVTNPVPGDSLLQLFPTSVNAHAFEYSGGVSAAISAGEWEGILGEVSPVSLHFGAHRNTSHT